MHRTIDVREAFVSLVSQAADALSDAVAENSGENMFTVEAWLLQSLADKLPQLIAAAKQAARADMEGTRSLEDSHRDDVG
jgi:hypothetical protein